MDETPNIDNRYVLADYITNPETDTYWISPIRVDESLDYLLELPEKHDTVTDDYRIADVGCGDGELTVELADRYPDADVTGLDIAPRYAQQAVDDYHEETGRDNAKIVGGDAYEILPNLEPFDFVYAINVIQDAPDVPEAIDTISDAAKEDAYVGATFTGEGSKYLFEDYLEYDEEADAERWVFENMDLNDEETVSFHQWIIPEDDAVTMFEGNGFEVVENRELAADKESLEGAMELMDPENETDVTEMDPAYPFYLFHRGEYDGE